MIGSKVCWKALAIAVMVILACTATSAFADTVSVRFFSQGNLFAIDRVVPTGMSRIEAAVRALVAGPTQNELAIGLNSMIPAGVSIKQLTISDDTVEVDMSSEVVVGLDDYVLEMIFEQFKATLSDFPSITTIALKSNGKWLRSYLSDGPVVKRPAPTVRISGVGLAGKKIAVGPSHGMLWRNGYWNFQRTDPCGYGEAVLEDTNSIRLVQFLKQYLTQDGAEFVCPRQLDETDCCHPEKNLPYWKMCAQSWLHYSGAPSSIWANASGNTGLDSATDRFADDIRARPLWADYNGSDIYIAHHTNAGGGTGTEVFYDSTMDYPAQVNNSKNLATALQNSIVNTIRSTFDAEPSWVSRGVKNSSGAYGEINRPNQPAVLLELAFHDLCGRDASYLTDDFFRSISEWAIYKGVCDYFGCTPTWDKYSCEYVSDTIPAEMECGKSYSVSVTMRNRGVSWFSDRGFRLGAVDGSDPFTSSTNIDLSGQVKPGQTYKFDFTLTAPSAAGSFVSDWQMVRNGYTSFGPIVSKTISVYSPGITKWAYLGPYNQGTVNQNALRINTDQVANTYNGIVFTEDQLAPGAVDGLSGLSYGNYYGTAKWNNINSPTEIVSLYTVNALRSKGVGGASNAYWYPDISIPNYTIVSGDAFEYDIYYPSSSQVNGALDFEWKVEETTGNLRDFGITDQNGVTSHPSANLSSYAYNKWYHRSIAISSLAGKTIQAIEAAHEADNATSEYFVRNVRIVNNGTTKYSSYTGESSWTIPANTYGPPTTNYTSTDIRVVAAHSPDNTISTDNAVTYCATYFKWTDATKTDAYLSTGSDDCSKVWLNGNVIGSYVANGGRGCVINSDLYGPFTLTQNTWYRLLMKVENGSGDYQIYARLVNSDFSATSTCTMYTSDTTVPTNPVACSVTGVSNGVWQRYVSSPVCTWFGANDAQGSNEGVSGIKGYKFYFGTSSTATPTTFQTSNTYSSPALADGIYYLRVKTVDNALNEADTKALYTFKYDGTAPTGSISINNGDACTASTTVTLTLSASDNASGVTQMRFSNDNSTWSNAETYATTKSWTLTSGDGAKIVYAQFKDAAGNWTTATISDSITLDITPPDMPIVTDDGAYSGSKTKLHATWSAANAESGISEYQYAVGTSAGAVDIVGWTSAATSTQSTIAIPAPGMQSGVTYFVSVKAKSGAGNWSEVGSSDGIQIAADAATISAAKALANGSPVALSNKVVTGSFADGSYIEETDRTSGILILANGLNRGSLISVGGVMGVNAVGERAIIDPAVIVETEPNVQIISGALFMTNGAIGGSNLNANTAGKAGGSGLNNVGLLVRVCGIVQSINANYFTIFDGSSMGALKIISTGVSLPTFEAGDFVTVTGISSLELDSTLKSVVRLLNVDNVKHLD